MIENEASDSKEKSEQNEKSPVAWWEKISGTFADDKDFEEAMRLGREYRLTQNDEKQ